MRCVRFVAQLGRLHARPDSTELNLDLPRAALITRLHAPTCFRASGSRFHTKRASGLRWRLSASALCSGVRQKDAECAQVVVVQMPKDVRGGRPVLVYVIIQCLSRQ